jgi:RNA polymerase sigma factor FliA
MSIQATRSAHAMRAKQTPQGQPAKAPTARSAAAKKADEDIARTWAEFKQTGDGTLRNVLVERYLYLVKVIANRISARLPRSIDVQDLRSAGIFGLIRAIENFDTSRGTRFESYCATRVHGAILDELRAQDFVPRLVRNRADLYRTAFTALRGRLDRDPSTREVAVHLGTTDEDANALRRESNLATVYTLSRDDESSEDSHQVRKLDVLVDRDSEVPFDELVTRDLASSFSNHLSRVERTVVALYYVDSLTMREIGEVLSISESRVCQIHTKLLKKLKVHLVSIVNGTDKPVRVPAGPRRLTPSAVATASCSSPIVKPSKLSAIPSISSEAKPRGAMPAMPLRLDPASLPPTVR